MLAYKTELVPPVPSTFTYRPRFCENPRTRSLRLPASVALRASPLPHSPHRRRRRRHAVQVEVKPSRLRRRDDRPKRDIGARAEDLFFLGRFIDEFHPIKEKFL